MSIGKHTGIILLGITLALASASAGAGDSWHFKVTNDAESKITKLQVSEDGKTWGYFDIGSGIAPGSTETLLWDKSTDNEGCEQYIRAVFADGSTSPPSRQDFCTDLDDPIVFSE